MVAYLYDDLVDTCKPGDFVELTGIFRASGVRILPRVRTLKSVYRNYIDANSIHKDHLNRYLVAEADMEGPAADGMIFDSDNSGRCADVSSKRCVSLLQLIWRNMRARIIIDDTVITMGTSVPR